MAEQLRGVLERADRLGVAGWARRGDAPVTLEVFAGGRAMAVVTADQYRADLAAERDSGCAFEAWFPEPLPTDRNVEVRVRSPDGRDLPGSPTLVRMPKRRMPGERLPDDGAPLALVVDEADPDPARDAGSVALLSHMAALRRIGLSVLFAPLAQAADAIADCAGRVRVAWLHRLRPMALLEPEIRQRNPGVHVVWSVADLSHLRARRQALVLGAVAPHALELAERAAARAADAVVTHSPAEAALLERWRPRPRAHWVPWSVPARPLDSDFASRGGIGFLGSYGHAPNLDAVRVLLEHVMPLVWRTAPIPCLLAGSGAPSWLRRFAESDSRISLLAHVPDTLALWRQVRVSAAPLRFGAGIKGKVLDSLAAGVPCVCSPVAAEGLELPPGLLAGAIPEMATMLLHLHADEAANAAAASAGQAMLAARHTDAVVDRALSWALAPH